MWKPRKEEDIPASAPAPTPTFTPKEVHAVETPKPLNDYRAEMAHIGKSVLVKGELSGSEDLYLDGEVEGSVELPGHSLTVGPHGRVRAHTRARDVVVHGKVDGDIQADRVELKKTAIHIGKIVTQRIVIEDGAFFKGSIDIQRENKVEAKPEPKPAASVATAAAAGASSPASAGVSAQPSLLEPKR